MRTAKTTVSERARHGAASGAAAKAVSAPARTGTATEMAQDAARRAAEAGTAPVDRGLTGRRKQRSRDVTIADGATGGRRVYGSPHRARRRPSTWSWAISQVIPKPRGRRIPAGLDDSAPPRSRSSRRPAVSPAQPNRRSTWLRAGCGVDCPGQPQRVRRAPPPDHDRRGCPAIPALDVGVSLLQHREGDPCAAVEAMRPPLRRSQATRERRGERGSSHDLLEETPQCRDVRELSARRVASEARQTRSASGSRSSGTPRLSSDRSTSAYLFCSTTS